jgi:hypothetical protein
VAALRRMQQMELFVRVPTFLGLKNVEFYETVELPFLKYSRNVGSKQ